jgi:hypothetical protein
MALTKVNTDLLADGGKLNGIEAGADVTDTANVTAAGALMDSELTSIASVKALDQGVATTDSPTFAGLNASGNLTLDVAGEIILDADQNGVVRINDAGSNFGAFFKNGTTFTLKSELADYDMIFSGNDGGATIDALTLDMSNAGYATFNSGLNSGGVIELPQKASFPATGFVHYTNSYLYAFGGVQGSIFKDRTGVNEFLKLQPSQIVFNEDGLDMDFRVESDSNANMLFVDGGNNSVSIGTSTQSAVLTIQSAGNGYSNGSIALQGAGISDTNYLTNAGGNFYISYDGTTDDFVIRSSELVINENGVDRDFRVESDTNANALFVDASQNTVVFGNNAVNLASGYSDQAGMGVHANDGYVQISSNSTPLTLGRTTAAGRGAHLIMRNASSVVCELGDYNGVPYIGYTGGAGGGIMFNGASIEPTAIGNARTNGANDIGSGNYRWRNGMFSNTVQAKTFERLWNFLDLQGLDMGYFYPVTLDNGSASVTQSFELFKYYGNYNPSLNGVVQHGACSLKLDIAGYSWGGNVIHNYLHHVGSTYRCMVGAVTLRGYYVPVIWLRGGYGYHWTSNNPNLSPTLHTSNTTFYSAPYSYTIGRITDSVMQGKTGYLGTTQKYGIVPEDTICNDWYT